MSGGHGAHHDAGDNKTTALVIATIALFLAVSEIMGHKTQVQTLQANIEASNLWAFYQAKTIRRSIAQTAAEQLEVELASPTNDTQKRAKIEDQIKKFKAVAERMESEPATKDKPGEGRKELMERAKEAEKLRDKAGAKNYRFGLASGAFQIAIVVASASIITGIQRMLWGAVGLGGVGLIVMFLGLIG